MPVDSKQPANPQGFLPSGKDPVDRFMVAGIGASAGGLEALTELLEALPGNTGIAFALTGHPDTHPGSALAEILSRRCRMPVRQIDDSTAAEPNCFYVTPPDTSLSIRDRILYLAGREPGQLNAPIDSFFTSLAADRGANAIGIVLSGMASDGTLGLKAIQAAGGITFCQDATARFDSMPRSAIAAGVVDYVFPPVRIATALASLAAHPYYGDREHFTRAQAGSSLRPILGLLRTISSVDLTRYKQETIQRRLCRRMALRNCEHPDAYLAMLRHEPAELQALFDDLLIHVTEFFRDAPVFEALKSNALPNLVKDRQPDRPIRIWVPGCSSGEEVYSLAITLLEFLGEQRLEFPLQIFGTDVSDRMLERARSGLYGESIASVLSPERLERFFIRTGAGFRISQTVRGICAFARHDLGKDPPLSRMDLISCRNLLIYLDCTLQQRAIASFGYALQSPGFLVLGPSESLGDLAGSFSVKDAANRIFFRRPEIPSDAFLSSHAIGSFEPARTPAIPSTRFDFTIPRAELSGPGNLRVEETPVPVSLVVDTDLHVLEVRGHLHSYLKNGECESGPEVHSMLRQEIAIALQSMIGKLSVCPLPSRVVALHDTHRVRTVRLSMIPVSLPWAPTCFVVLIETTAVSSRTAISDSPGEPEARSTNTVDPQRHAEHLEKNLNSTRQCLQALVGELRRANEEARSANEQLQSTNEELQTAQEELQSTNEELHTINAEMQSRNAQLAEANDDLTNLLSSMNMPIVMIGGDLRIRRFTPTAEAVLNLLPTDIGRPVSDFQPRIEVPDLIDILHRVLDTLIPFEREVRDRNGSLRLLRIRPYRTADQRIDGAVLQLLDIGQINRSLEEAREARDYAKAVVDTVRESLLVLDRTLVIKDANRSLLAAFGVSRSDIVNRPLAEAGQQFQISRLPEILNRLIVSGSAVEEVEVEHELPTSGRRVLNLAARRIDLHAGGPLVLLVIQDVTERKQAAEARYRRLFESSHDGIVIVDAATGKIADMNPSAAKLLGYSRQDLVGKKVWQAGPMDNEWRADLEKAREQGMVRIADRTMRTKDGRSVQAEIIVTAYGEGDHSLVQFNIRDMTERRRFDQQLQHTAKLESLGLLAGGIAHDFNNLLTGVLGNASLVYTRSTPGDPDRPLLREIMRSAERAAHLTRQMLAYAGKGTFLLEHIDLTAFIPDTLPLIHSSIPRIVEVRLQLDPNTPPIDADPGQIQQVLMNLVINAAEAIGDAPGRINLETRSVHLGSGAEWADAYSADQLLPGEYVLIRVEDTGSGMDEATRARIFDPFFTTKFTGRGLGLAAVQGIVRAHGGAVRVYSSPGNGTSFEVLLPPAAPRPPEEPRSAPRRRTSARGLVLVVDDEHAVRNVAKAALEWAGFDVLTAENGEAALQLFEQRHEDIRVVLLDLLMPVMGGEETLARMQAIHPGIPIVLISGFDEEEALRRLGFRKFAGFVQKPFTMDALRDEIAAVLDF